MYFSPNNGADTSGFIILYPSSLIMSTMACAGDFSVEPATSSFSFSLVDEFEEGRVSTKMPIGFC